MRLKADKIFFEIPIYRCTSEEHSKLMIQKRNQHTSPNDGSWVRLLDRVGTTYEYWHNEVIGYIYLYVLGTQIRGCLYMDKSERKRSGIRKKNFVYVGDAFQILILNNMSSDDIFKELLQELERINKDDFKKRYIDIEAIKNSGKFMDWRKLMDELDPYTNMKDNSDWMKDLLKTIEFDNLQIKNE